MTKKNLAYLLYLTLIAAYALALLLSLTIVARSGVQRALRLGEE